jgi:hypothetical protein
MKIFEVYILLYLVVSASSFTIHLYYLSETVSILPMFHLLFRWIIVESSDVFGYRVWILTSLVVSSWTGRLASILPASCQASCQLVSILRSASCQLVCILPDCFIRILVSSGKSSLLVVVHPVGSLQVL